MASLSGNFAPIAHSLRGGDIVDMPALASKFNVHTHPSVKGPLLMPESGGPSTYELGM